MEKHPEYQYLDLLREAYEHGVKNVDRGTGAVSYGLFGRQTRYDLSKGFPLLTTKKVYWKGVLHELYWFLSGQSNIKYLVDNNVHLWDDYPYKTYKELAKTGKIADLSKEDFVQKIKDDAKFAERYGELPKIYGELWRRWPTRTPGRTIDQLKWVITELSEDTYARNAIVTSWNPEYLYSMANREDACRFPICHNMYQVSVKGGKLNLQLYQRSADLFLGVPFNIASYSLLTHILAQVLGYEPGEFVHTFGDVHIYEIHLDQAKEQLSREPKPLPSIKIDPSVKNIDSFKPEHVLLENYDPHPLLKGEFIVIGGLFTPTVAVLIFKNDQVLLVKHGSAAKHITNVMGLPSGLVESGETEIQAAIRELKEETGLITTETDLIEFPNNYYSATIPLKDGSVEKFDWRVYLCKNYSGELQSADENETIPIWIKIDELESLNLLPNVINATKSCLKYQKNLNDENS